MKITKQIITKHVHHTVEVDGHPVFRNEDMEYDELSNTWKRKKMHWVVGDSNGNGPYGILEYRKFKYTTEQMEREFQLQIILQEDETIL